MVSKHIFLSYETIINAGTCVIRSIQTVYCILADESVESGGVYVRLAFSMCNDEYNC